LRDTKLSWSTESESEQGQAEIVAEQEAEYQVL
jgi:hypothetical protein